MNLIPYYIVTRKKQELNRDKERREQDDYIALEDEFKNLFRTIVHPSMTKMVNYLESKGDVFKGSYVKVSPHLAKISLIINAYKLRQGSDWTEIEFSRDVDKLKIKKNENNVTTEALFEKSELNLHFVRRKLIDFVKSYYTTNSEW
jgi:hypothetical protein